ncbi:MAG: radical SAM protein, partial [Myxococcota bacterium]
MSEFTEIPWSLVERYDRPLPRYTSYPTVPHWCEATAPSVVEGWDRVASGEARVSVYVHVPFCHRMCLYCGCNTTVTKRQDVIERYVDALCMEIAQVRARVGAKPLAQLHFGGGTPSLLPVPLLERLLGAIYDAFAPTEDAEISMELDPTVTTAQH